MTRLSEPLLIGLPIKRRVLNRTLMTLLLQPIGIRVLLWINWAKILVLAAFPIQVLLWIQLIRLILDSTRLKVKLVRYWLVIIKRPITVRLITRLKTISAV